jgi:hypothetical protein
VNDLDAQLLLLAFQLGRAVGALSRFDAGGAEADDGLRDFLAARRDTQALARALPITPSDDGGMDLSRLPADARARMEHQAARVAGALLGVDRGNVSCKTVGAVRLSKKEPKQ